MPQSKIASAARRFILRDLYTFCEQSGIVPDIREQPHREMTAELEEMLPDKSRRRQRKKIYLAPRGSYKTSLIKGLIVYAIYKDLNIRIVYGRAQDADAMNVVRAIKEVMQSNQLLIDLFGDLSKTASIWSEDRIVVKRPNETLVDPTLVTTALGRTLTGAHPDLVILDDLVTDVNYKSPRTTDRSRTLVQAVYPVLEPWGSVILAGTRWAWNDIYGWQIQQDDLLEEEGHTRQWSTYVRAVENNGEWFFPDKLGPEFVEQQRQSLRQQTMLFSSWYYNQPFETGTKLFPKHMISYFDADFYRSPGPHLEMPSGEYIPLYIVMTVDPAPTAGLYSDFTGITIVGYDWQGRWYILWAEAIKKPPSSAGMHLVELANRYHPDIIGIETGMADPSMVARLSDGLKDQGIKSRITSYSALRDEAPGKRGKSQRIEALEPLFREGVIRLRSGVLFRELLAQLDGYGALDHDDVIDALAMQRVFAKPCKEKSQFDQEDNLEVSEEADSWGPNGKPDQPIAPRLVSGIRVGRQGTVLQSR